MAKPRVDVEHLGEGDVALVAGWLTHQWDASDGYTQEQVAERTRYCLNTDALPQTYLARLDDVPCGTASLWLNDHKFRPDLSPWVAGVYVTEECRGRGVAQALLAFAAENTWKLGYDRLFAVTPLTGFYEKCGWTYHADGICPHGQQKRIYAVDRSSSS